MLAATRGVLKNFANFTGNSCFKSSLNFDETGYG